MEEIPAPQLSKLKEDPTPLVKLSIIITQYFSYQRWSSSFEGPRVSKSPREGGSVIISFPWKCWVSVYFQHRQLVSKFILRRSDPFNGSISPGKKVTPFPLSLSFPFPIPADRLGRVLTCIVKFGSWIGAAGIGRESGANLRLRGNSAVIAQWCLGPWWVKSLKKGLEEGILYISHRCLWPWDYFSSRILASLSPSFFWSMDDSDPVLSEFLWKGPLDKWGIWRF